MDCIEIIKQISILIGIWVAIYSIDAWRREHIGKRQIELAEETLALFYEASDAIKHMRHPARYGHETESMEKGDGESQENYEARKNASVVFYRYNEHQELFNKLHASRYRFMAQIGKEESKPFDDLRNIVNEIVLSARVLGRLWARNNFRTEEAWKRHQKNIEKHEKVFWDDMDENDQINQKIDEVIKEIEKTCQSIISGKSSLYGAINKKVF